MALHLSLGWEAGCSLQPAVGSTNVPAPVMSDALTQLPAYFRRSCSSVPPLPPASPKPHLSHLHQQVRWAQELQTRVCSAVLLSAECVSSQAGCSAAALSPSVTMVSGMLDWQPLLVPLGWRTCL